MTLAALHMDTVHGIGVLLDAEVVTLNQGKPRSKAFGRRDTDRQARIEDAEANLRNDGMVELKTLDVNRDEDHLSLRHMRHRNVQVAQPLRFGRLDLCDL